MVPVEYLPLGYSRNHIVGCILSQMPYIVVTVNLQARCRVQVSFHVAVFKRKSGGKKIPSHGKINMIYKLRGSLAEQGGGGGERVGVCVGGMRTCSVVSSSLQPCGL